MNYRYLFSDMDGTLLDRNGEIPELNLEAIRDYMQRGGYFTVATGRGEIIARPFFEKLKTNLPAILFNGAGIYDYDQEKYLYKATLSNDIVRQVYEIAVKVYPTICFQAFAEGPIRQFNPNGVTDHIAVRENQPMIRKGHSPEDEYIKLLLYGEHSELQKVADAIVPLAEGNFTSVFSFPFYLEVLPLNCSKGAAMRWVMEHFQIPKEQTAAIGDYDNDLPLLEQAALGAAPANAQDCVKAAADVIVADHNDGAVADLIRTYCL